MESEYPTPPTPVIDLACAAPPPAVGPRRLSSLTSVLPAARGRIGIPEVLARVRWTMTLNLPSLVQIRQSRVDGALLICGGGPSIGDPDQLRRIRALKYRGGKIWAVNKTHDFLLSRGIVPWAACLLDPMPWVADYVARPRMDVIYAVASQCHPDVLARLKDYPVYLWHAGIDGDDGLGHPTPMLAREFADKEWLVIPGPTTVGLRSILVGYALGYRRFHLFGLDSSMRRQSTAAGGTVLHAYAKAKPGDAAEGSITLRTKNREHRFFTNAHMARQVLDFEDMAERLAEMVRSRRIDPIRIVVHGDGLLPELAKCYGWHESQDHE
jgi:hypothetical protein